MNYRGASGNTEVSAEWALRLLLHHGLLTPRDAMAADLRAEETSMSHTAFCVRVAGEPRWYVKRADLARSQGRDLGSEATVYRMAAYHPVLREVLPRCRLIGEGDNALVLDAIPGTPLSSLLPTQTRGPLTRAETLRAYGAAVARVHSVRCHVFGSSPWMIEALEPRWGGYGWLPQQSAALLSRLAASHKYQRAFRQAQSGWRLACLVHGDLRYSNVLAGRPNQELEVRLIDWELACLGDPAWDVGGFLADAVGTAVLANGLSPSLEHLLAESASILNGYYTTSFPTRPAWVALLRRSLRLAGVRLIQTIIEYDYAFGQQTASAEDALLPWSAWLFDRGPSVVPQVALAAEKAAPA